MTKNQKMYKTGYWLRLIGLLGFLIIFALNFGPVGFSVTGSTSFFRIAMLTSLLIFIAGHYLANKYKNGL
jgi:hypothetical protein